MTARCHICGAPASAAASSPGTSRCDECAPTRDHVVSMRTAPDGDSLAVCPCGWKSKVGGKGRGIVQDAKVRQHWRAVIRIARQAIAAQPVWAGAAWIFTCGAIGAWLGGL